MSTPQRLDTSPKTSRCIGCIYPVRCSFCTVQGEGHWPYPGTLIPPRYHCIHYYGEVGQLDGHHHHKCQDLFPSLQRHLGGPDVCLRSIGLGLCFFHSEEEPRSWSIHHKSGKTFWNRHVYSSTLQQFHNFVGLDDPSEYAHATEGRGSFCCPQDPSRRATYTGVQDTRGATTTVVPNQTKDITRHRKAIDFHSILSSEERF